MPEVFADEQADASELGVEGLAGVAPGEEAAFIEKAVGGQVDVVVTVEDAPARKVGRSDVEAVTGVLVHEANDEVEVVAGFEEVLEDGVIVGRMMGDGRDDVLQNVTREGKFGEDEQVGVLRFGLFDEVEMLLEVGLDVPQVSGDLR